MVKIESISFKWGVKLWPKNVIGFGGMKADRSGKTAGDIFFIIFFFMGRGRESSAVMLQNRVCWPAVPLMMSSPSSSSSST